MSAIVVIANAPDQTVAKQIALAVIAAHAGACVNILAPCTSVYAWAGKLERTTEIPLLIKSTADKYSEVEAIIRANHPYEVPEIIAIPVVAGLPEYLSWVTAETRSLAST